jgi:tetraacyldisaccharide-1-P 4'-kinase
VERATGHSIPGFGQRRALEFVTAESQVPAEFVEGPVAAVSSVARPGRFENDIISKGADLKLAIRYPDHHRYNGGDVRFVAGALERRGIRRVVTTDKDWAKLREMELPFESPVLARLVLRLDGFDVIAQMEAPQAVPAAHSR